jgi:cytochrome c oxidase subunit 3
MPGTITDDVEIIDAGHGGGTDVPAGGDDDGDGHGGGGLPAIPQRAYFTAIQLALAGIVMFFMALTSSFLVRKGLGDDWVSFALPRVLWANTLVLLASSGAIQFARARLRSGDTEGFRRWWAITTALGALFLAGQFAAWRQLAAQGVFLATNPSSSFFYLLTALHGLHLLGPGSARESPNPLPRIWFPFTGTSWTGCGSFYSRFSTWDGETCTRRKAMRPW